MDAAPVRNKVFISYSHKDVQWLDQLRSHLAAFEGTIDYWDDTQIDPGANWKNEIEAALRAAKVAVFLVTPTFLASRFIKAREMGPLLEAEAKEGLTVLWIAVRASNYEQTAIGNYQAVNDPAEPLNTLGSARRDREWVKVSRRILQAVNTPIPEEAYTHSESPPPHPNPNPLRLRLRKMPTTMTRFSHWLMMQHWMICSCKAAPWMPTSCSCISPVLRLTSAGIKTAP